MIRSPKILIAFDSRADAAASESDYEFVLAPPRLWTSAKLLLAPTLWVGESFTGGSWYLRKGDLSDFLALIRKDAPRSFGRYYEFTAALRGVRYYLRQRFFHRYYTRKVKGHYELDSRIYELILDEEMLYTCAFFNDGKESLEVAQQQKLAAAIARMELPNGVAKILDIGCGWGAMARALVIANPRAELCGISLSRSQIEWALKRDVKVLTADQSRRIEYRVEDYVDHDRKDYYDAVSIVGMIEHVGLGGYPAFFGCLSTCLKPGGKILIHTIISPTSGRPTNRWIDRHIFTGGYAPSIAELVAAIERHPLRVTGMYLYGPHHYRMTIEHWLLNLKSNIATMFAYFLELEESQNDAARFTRTWLFYLSAVRNMFSEDNARSHQVVQMMLTKLGG